MDKWQRTTLLIVDNWSRKLYIEVPTALCFVMANFNKILLTFDSELVGRGVTVMNDGQKAERTQSNGIVMFKEALPNFKITNCPFNNQMYRGYQIEITNSYVTTFNLQMGITNLCPQNSNEKLQKDFQGARLVITVTNLSFFVFIFCVFIFNFIKMLA